MGVAHIALVPVDSCDGGHESCHEFRHRTERVSQDMGEGGHHVDVPLAASRLLLGALAALC